MQRNVNGSRMSGTVLYRRRHKQAVEVGFDQVIHGVVPLVLEGQLFGQELPDGTLFRLHPHMGVLGGVVARDHNPLHPPSHLWLAQPLVKPCLWDLQGTGAVWIPGIVSRELVVLVPDG